MKTAMITGSWGEIEVNIATGDVVCLHREPIYEGNERGYRDIAKFDLTEWRVAYPGEPFRGCDILDVGYWMKDGRYEPPAYDWRADYRNSLCEIDS